MKRNYSREIIGEHFIAIVGTGLENSSFRSPGNSHQHPFVEIHFIRQGQSVLKTAMKEIILKDQSAVLIPPGIEHAILPATTDSKRIAFFLVSKKKEADLSVFSEIFGEKAVRLLNDDFGGGKQAEELNREMEHGGIYSEMRAKAILQRIVIDFCRVLVGDSGGRQVARRSEQGEIEDYIRGNYALRPSIEELAKKLGMSPRNVSRRVQALYQKSFRQLILEQRMSMARLYLEYGMSLAEVAERLGYAETSALSHAFKKFYGETPLKLIKKDI